MELDLEAPHLAHMDDTGPGMLPFIIALVALVLYVLHLFSELKPFRTRHTLEPKHRAILAKYAIHYQRLDEKARRRFEHIVASFIHEKEWRGAGMVVADEMKVMIGACAAELLLGFPDAELKHFHRIVVFPDTYRSSTGRMHQGEVRPKAGTIIISWRDFLHGYAHTRDAHNVGLHEMAHALWFEHKLREGRRDLLHPELFQDWIDHADAEIERIRSGKSRLLRGYAGTNQPEFFAVAVEYFFEQPQAFKEDLPDLYATLSAMLRQDPAAVAGRKTEPAGRP